MMLQALIAYAERKNLGDAFFETIGVSWQISIDNRGRLVTPVIPLGTGSGGGKSLPLRRIRPKSNPDFVGHGRSYFLCDTLARSVYYVKDQSHKAKRLINHRFFAELIIKASERCSTEKDRLLILHSFLTNESEIDKLHQALVRIKALESENVIFTVDGYNFLESPEIKQFWIDFNTKPGGLSQAICLATGSYGPICGTTGFIKGLNEDVKLISFNKECPAFESFGLEQAGNAAISTSADLKINSALDALIAKSKERGLHFPKRKGDYPGLTFISWTREDIPFDPVDFLAKPTEKDVDNLLRNVRKGTSTITENEKDYYATAISSNGPRLQVRRWIESTVAEVKESVARWFQDLEIINYNGEGLKSNFSLGELIASILPKKDGQVVWDSLPPELFSDLFFSAVGWERRFDSGLPLHPKILYMAVKRQLLEIKSSKLNPARMALIQIYLLRSLNKKENKNMRNKLDIESTDRAYLCGCLFAVMSRVQLLALGKVGASIVDRTYGGVATRPSTTFGPLFMKVPAYIKKANVNFPGSGTNKHKEIEQICVRLQELGGIQKTFDLEEQGRFALGYYCQLAQYRADSIEHAAADVAEQMENEELI